MTQTAKQIIQEATLRQNNAADVNQSVWVSASAGTGKTYVLTKRILGLLLEDKLLKPSEILAVTFTRAAAREMEERIRSKLRFWATCSEDELEDELQSILGGRPSQLDIKRARTLFADVLDDGVNSNTIHGFCQQVLAKFPLEAGVSPGFKLIEGKERDTLLASAKIDVFASALNDEIQPSWVFDFYAGELGEKSLDEALESFVSSAGRFRRYFERYGGVQSVLKNLADDLNVDGRLTPASFRIYENEICKFPEKLQNRLKGVMDALLHGSPTVVKAGNVLAGYLDGSSGWEAVKATFLTAAGKPKSERNFPSKGALNYAGDMLLVDVQEMTTHILNVEEKLKAARAFLLTSAYLNLGSLILSRYETLKVQENALDFDDLIAKSAELLTNEEQSAWVRFKMDTRIKHVLLDEAQDTDSDQWGIVRALVSEFYAGRGLHEEIHEDSKRTFFAVGDIKQSIYRFRGAEPHVFGAMRDYLNHHKQAAGHAVVTEELIVSFRSTEPVLKFVDVVFDEKNRQEAVDELVDEIEHRAARIGSSGHIEIFPLLEKKKKEKKEQELWPLPSKEKDEESLKVKLAAKVARQIQALLNSGEVLESSGKTIGAGDIMLLLRNRGMMPTLIAALDELRIPHAGADQVDLHKEVVVEDLLALLKWFSQKSDCLSLAHVLRSPLFGYNDAELDTLVQTRKGKQQLWDVLPKNNGAGQVLRDLKSQVKKQSLFSFVNLVIQHLDIRGKYYQMASADERLSVVSSVDDAVDTLLDMALQVQQSGGSLLAFVHEFENTTQKLKRELEGGSGLVRLMTAHGSKGLEAPIVIMPDTTGGFYKNMASDKPLWQTTLGGEDTLFMHRQPSAEAPSLQKDFEEAEKLRVFRDEMRLLYVALTRAKERLYVYGIKQHGYNAENCWYGHIVNAVDGHDLYEEVTANHYVHRVENNLTASDVEDVMETSEVDNPAWVSAIAENEKGLVLVQASDTLKRKEQLQLLNQNEDKLLFKRGKLVHRLLEVLPNVEPSKRQEQGLRFLNQTALDFSENERESLLNSALSVLVNYPEFFGENSRSEVSVAAVNGNKQLEGVIDRLVVNDDSVVVVDYKTNAKVPNVMPHEYKMQLNHYKNAVSQIFPGKSVRACLIWTSLDAPRIEWLA